MFINNLNPILFRISFLQIRYYGLVYIIGFLLAYYFLNKNRKKLQATKDQIDTIMFFLIIGLVIGARLFDFIFTDPFALIKDPLEFFKIWHGGMSFFGGLTGSFIAVYFYLKKQKLKFFNFADILVIPGAIALILGRIANFINSELIGTITNVPWCVVFAKIDNICRHPYQLYAALSHLLLLIIIIIASKIKRKNNLKEGYVFSIFLISYGFLRLMTDFFRVDPRLFHLSIWQYLSILLIVAGFVVLFGLKKKKNIKQSS